MGVGTERAPQRCDGERLEKRLRDGTKAVSAEEDVPE
jgi:hypothetical protein